MHRSGCAMLLRADAVGLDRDPLAGLRRAVTRRAGLPGLRQATFPSLLGLRDQGAQLAAGGQQFLLAAQSGFHFVGQSKPFLSRPWAQITERANDFLTRPLGGDRKSTRLNSSHLVISYAVFCLKKKKKNKR